MPMGAIVVNNPVRLAGIIFLYKFSNFFMSVFFTFVHLSSYVCNIRFDNSKMTTLMVVL